MRLLERETPLRELEQVWAEAGRGAGRVALVGGEAGVGKSSLVDWFVRRAGRGAPRLWGACDALFTPRPLGPLYDMAEGAPWLATLLADRTAGPALFAAFLDELRARPTIAVFEDVHWADEATLDLLRHLGRRITHTRSLLVMTYRDDELGPAHPLRAVLGDLTASAVVRRLTLAPLSDAAVAALAAGRPVDPVALHRQTGGNPFFVTEVLAAVGSLPPTVRDAVLARAARLSPAARALLEAAAVLGLRAEVDLLTDVGGTADPAAALAALEECLAGGMMLWQGQQVAFRHDLSREAILAAILPPRRLALQRRALAALALTDEAKANPARLAHHAEAAGDGPAVRRYAAAAARQSAAAGAHRAAADQYELALRHAGELPPAELARLLEAYATECNLVDRRAEGVEVCLRAAAIWQQLGRPVRQGHMLAVLANMLIGVGRGGQAERYLAEALALLEAHPPGPELAFAYRMRAAVAFLDHDYRPSIGWAEKTIAVAEGLGDSAAALPARNLIGSALLFLDYEAGCRALEDNLARAQAAGAVETAGHAYANLGSASCELYHLRRAERYLAEGIPFAIEHDLDRYRFYMTAWLAMTQLRLGRWAEVADTADQVLRLPGVSIPSRITALTALGLLRARRGEPGAAEALEEALALTLDLSSLHRVGLVRAARAEAAWLAGDGARAAAEAAAAWELARAKRHPWFGGELVYWMWLAGGRGAGEQGSGGAGGSEEAGEEERAWLAEPFRLEMGGEWRAAAVAWERLRCPYEAARALAGGDQAAQREALRRFEQLGVAPAAEALRRRLRRAGATSIPRGPRPATRDNPYGLTNRQLDVLRLLAEGLTNAQIAARLTLSPKTVDHHVSAVLAKLDVATREEAAERVRRGDPPI